MFARIFGNDRNEMLIGVAAFVVVFSLILIGICLVVSPIVGDAKTETKLSVEIVKVLASLISGAFGFLLGSGMAKKEGKSDD